MIRLLRGMLVLFLGGVFVVGTALAKANTTTIRFVYTGDLGRLYYDYRKPDEALIKGFETKILQEKSKKVPSVFLDTGHFIEPPIVSETSYASRPVRFFQQAGFGAINLTPKELVGGMSYVESWGKLSPAPPLISDLRSKGSGKPLAPLSRSMDVKGVTIAILGATDIANVSALPDIQKQFDTAGIIESLKAEVARLSATSDLVIVLSDLEPAMNDKLAHEAPGVDIIFENRLKQADAVRKVSKTVIASRSGLFAYDVLSVKVEGAHTITEYKPEAVFYGPKPGEKAFAEIVPLPEIGAELPNLDFLKRLNVPFEGVEIIRTVADFQDSRLGNSLIYYYKMYRGSAYLGDAFYVRHYLGSGHLNFDWLVFLDLQNKVSDFRLLSPMVLGLQTVNVYDFRADMLGKAPGDVQFKMEKLRGVEDYFTMLKDDLRALGEINAKVLQRRIP
jgi:2',3'-cyclic-nucleotide 2'-phosphodiesterase (5'-nucleotidase family)